jgi:hypothetical protein
MDLNKLSELYFQSTNFIHKLTTELYEDIHNNDGSPLEDGDLVKSKVDAFVKTVRLEVDLIRRAIQEHNEQ